MLQPISCPAAMLLRAAMLQSLGQAARRALLERGPFASAKSRMRAAILDDGCLAEARAAEDWVLRWQCARSCCLPGGLRHAVHDSSEGGACMT